MAELADASDLSSDTFAEVNNLPGQAIMVNRTEHTCVGMGCSDNSRIKIIIKDGNGILHTYDLGGYEGELFLNAKVGDNLKNPNW